ncbi:MAG: hypothetical protein ACRC92_27050 [Peptostreptococcaceae bacterium]
MIDKLFGDIRKEVLVFQISSSLKILSYRGLIDSQFNIHKLAIAMEKIISSTHKPDIDEYINKLSVRIGMVGLYVSKETIEKVGDGELIMSVVEEDCIDINDSYYEFMAIRVLRIINNIVDNIEKDEMFDSIMNNSK